MDVYEHTHSFDRNGCIVGATFVSYEHLERWYVCIECGGTPVHLIQRVEDVTQDLAECAQCGVQDFMPLWLYEQQVREYYEIMQNLPPELQALFPEPEPLDITADEAIEQLYG